MDHDAANNARDARLRKRMLDALHRARVSPLGGLNARTLADVVDAGSPPGQGIQEDEHAIGLLKDLANAGYVTIEDKRTHKHQRHSIDWLFAKVTAAGSKLALEKAPVDALVDDGRRDGSEVD
jgi:hypothetical protein